MDSAEIKRVSPRFWADFYRMQDLEGKMMPADRLVFWVLLFVLAVSLGACKSRKPGECKSDTDCKDQVKGVGVCFRGSEETEIGRCMTVKEARAARESLMQKRTGACEDRDGDGFGAGTACETPIDCNDADPAVNPGAAELCDVADNNCNQTINEGLSQCVGTVLGGKTDPVVGMVTTATSGVEVAPNGDLWVTDLHRIYRIKPNGEVKLVAGSHMPGYQDGEGDSARFHDPRGLAVDQEGNVYVADCSNNCVRRINPGGQVAVYAGKCSSQPDDTGLDQDGDWQRARFWCPVDVAIHKDGSILVVDMYNAKIKRITTQRQVHTVAGRGGMEDQDGYVVFGYKNGPAKQAQFDQPAGIAIASDGTVYIADRRNNCIRKLKQDNVSDFAGRCKNGSDQGGHLDGKAQLAEFRLPDSVDVGQNGSVYVADTHNHCIRKIHSGRVTTIAGSPKNQGYYDGSVDQALFNGPQTISLSRAGRCFIADTGNYRIRTMICP